MVDILVKVQKVGVVHPREFVLREEAVDKIGLAKLYAMNNGKVDVIR